MGLYKDSSLNNTWPLLSKNLALTRMSNPLNVLGQSICRQWALVVTCWAVCTLPFTLREWGQWTEQMGMDVECWESCNASLRERQSVACLTGSSQEV